MLPEKVIIEGQHVRERNWGVLTQAIEDATEGQTTDWFDSHHLEVSWAENEEAVESYNVTAGLLEFLHLVNLARTRANSPDLRFFVPLCRIAEIHSSYMASTGDVQHDAPGNPFTNRIKPFRGFNVAGECIGVGFPTTNLVVEAWFNSPENQANLLKDWYQLVGLGVALSKTKRVYWTIVLLGTSKTGPNEGFFYTTPVPLISPGSATPINPLP